MKKQFSVFLACLLVFFLSIPGHADQVKEKTVNGVQVIENPKKPVPPEGVMSKMTLREEFSIGEGEFDEDMFADLTSLDVDSDGNIYILDRKDKKVKIFDSAGKFVKKFGKEGQGPGEFYLPLSLQVTYNNELVIGDAANQRLMFFSLEGELLREISAAAKKALGLALPLIDSQGNIVGQQLVTAESQLLREVRKYDSELNTLFTIASIDNTNMIQGKINPFQVILFYQLGKENSIYISNPDEYEIKVLTAEGKLMKRILKDYESVEVTEKDKEEFLERVPEIAGPIKDRIEFPKVYPAYQNFTLDEEWRLFVRTFEKGKEEGEFFFDVFDVEGRYIAKIPFKGEPRVWKGKKLYAVEEDEDGFQILKVYSVQWE
ncbi:MAG: 6-bladed beta-propeller [Candidatus Aminicenantes bacterium]|nr:MAG: 6-bladed beta-propeller [Candidatus Aminicenantes bacterium]